jgi:hypothetical protein
MPGPSVHYNRHTKRLEHAKGTSRQRRRRFQEHTARPQHEQKKAAPPERQGKAPGIAFRAPTKTRGGSPVDLVSTLTSPALDPAGNLLRDIAGQQAGSDVGAVKESWQEALGHNLGGLKSLPSGRQAGAALDIAALTSLGAAAGRGVASDASRSLPQALGDLAKSPPTLRGLVGRGLAKAEPGAVKTARTAAVAKVPAPVRIAAGAGARAASLAIRRPFTAPVAAQIPTAALHGDPGELGKAFTGKGTFAGLTQGAAAKAGAALPGELGKLAQEAIDVPAAILPTTYLAGSAGAKAIGGNSTDLEKLWDQYKKTGFLPAIFEGRAGQVFKERPIWSLLEASGAKAAVGRGLGIGARAISRNKVGAVTRPDLEVLGYPNLRVPRKYSRDLLRQGLQWLNDRRTGNKVDLRAAEAAPKRRRSPGRWATGS